VVLHPELVIADPQRQLGDLPRPRLDLDAVELPRPHLLHAKLGALRLLQNPDLRLVDELPQLAQHFQLDPLHRVQRHVQEVAAPARRVEEAQRLEPPVELAETLLRGGPVLLLAGLQELDDLRLHRVPAVADRNLDGLPDHALHVGPRRVLRAELVPLPGVERPRQQRPEDGGLHLLPVRLRRLEQHRQVRPGERQRRGVAEEVPVEPEELLEPEAPPLVHGPPQLLHRCRELRRVLAVLRERRLERLAGEQLHVLREHGEHAAHEELRDDLRVVPAVLQRRRKLRQPRRNLARHRRRAPARIQRGRVLPDGAEEVDLLRPVRQRAQVDAARQVEAAVRARPAVPRQQRAPHVQHQQVRRRCVRQVHRVVLPLRVRRAERHLPRPVAPLVLGLQDEVVHPVQVHEVLLPLPRGAVHRGERVLELVARPARLRPGHAERIRQVREVELVVGALARGNVGPLVGEGAELVTLWMHGMETTRGRKTDGKEA
jgi:hypothetical protein